MRLNDPQIELVHDDPFMGYIESAPAQTDAGTAASIRRRAPLDSIADGEDTPSAADDDVDEDVDVGDESSRHAPPPPLPPASPRADRAAATASTTTTGSTSTDQSIVIVLLVE